MPSRKPIPRFEDIIENVELVLSYTAGLDPRAFAEDRMRRDAVERCLERISEAARKIGPLAQEVAPGQPWTQIRAFGNMARHEYDQTQPGQLWAIVERLSSLRDDCVAAITMLRAQGHG